MSEEIDALELRRLLLAVGLASVQGGGERVAPLLEGLDGQSASALLIGLAGSWVNALELLLAEQGHADPKAAVLELLQEEALEVAGE
ncbi:hypothetical protein AB0D14_02090 [Streptomyces sp. NPDC048484]|uniref:hypothetical protein n=1 Tax=Streptomyces sp. NPDC048484 TaxID=3155146 RepID=UPI003425A90B